MTGGRVGHDVGWDVYDCPTCGPLAPGETWLDHRRCDDQHLADATPAFVFGDPLDIGSYLAASTSEQTEYEDAARRRITASQRPTIERSL